MSAARLRRLLAHWRTWWDAATIAFAVWLFLVLLRPSSPRVPREVFRLGLPVSVGLFFVGFACLAWRQRREE